MTGDTEAQLGKLRRARSIQTFVNTSLLVAVVALGIAVTILYISKQSGERTTYVVVQEQQEALKTACRVAENSQLPADVQKKCDEADRGEFTRRIAEVVDNPDPNDPDPNDPESQDEEIQDSEIQDSETQEPEVQDPETQDPEVDDAPVPGPAGNQGDKGDKGDTGDKGDKGDTGAIGPQGPAGPPCSDGFVKAPFHYFGPDGIDNTGDEEDWEICKRVG